MARMTKITLHDVLEINQRIEEKLDKITERVSTLELWRAEIMGKVSIAVGLVTIIANLAWESVKSKFTQ